MRKKITVFAIFAILTSVIIVGNVKAEESENGVSYEENAFTNEQCIEDESWMTTAKTSYSLDAEEGIFELQGDEYNTYISDTEKEKIYIFYDTSETGKTLYGYIPNYKTLLENATIKEFLSSKDIIVTSKCDKTLRVSKTVIGGEYIDESKERQDELMALPEESEKSEDNNENEIENKNEEASIEMQTINVPDTASLASIVGIITGAILITVGGVLLFKIYVFTDNKGRGRKE